MKPRLTSTWISFLLLCTNLCAAPQPTPETDASLYSRIIGSWTSDTDEGTAIMRYEKTYSPDGTATARIYEVGKGTKAGRVEQVGSSTSRWKVEQGYLVTYDHVTIPADVVARDKVFKDRIIKVDEQEFVIFDTDENVEAREHRKKD